MERFVKATLDNTYVQVQKICEMLNERLEKIRSRALPGNLINLWGEYLAGIDCEVLNEDEAREEFESLFNYSARTRICVSFSHTYSHTYILVPKELAEKALVLGGLPDEWSPETSEP